MSPTDYDTFTSLVVCEVWPANDLTTAQRIRERANDSRELADSSEAPGQNRRLRLVVRPKMSDLRRSASLAVQEQPELNDLPGALLRTATSVIALLQRFTSTLHPR